MSILLALEEVGFLMTKKIKSFIESIVIDS